MGPWTYKGPTKCAGDPFGTHYDTPNNELFNGALLKLVGGIYGKLLQATIKIEPNHRPIAFIKWALIKAPKY